jgi:hypothetical protein
MTIGACVGTGLLLLLLWMLLLTGHLEQAGDLGRGANLVFFVGGTVLLMAGTIVAALGVGRRRSPGRDR